MILGLDLSVAMKNLGDAMNILYSMLPRQRSAADHCILQTYIYLNHTFTRHLNPREGHGYNLQISESQTEVLLISLDLHHLFVGISQGDQIRV